MSDTRRLAASIAVTVTVPRTPAAATAPGAWSFSARPPVAIAVIGTVSEPAGWNSSASPCSYSIRMTSPTANSLRRVTSGPTLKVCASPDLACNVTVRAATSMALMVAVAWAVRVTAALPGVPVAFTSTGALVAAAGAWAGAWALANVAAMSATKDASSFLMWVSL